MKRGNLLVALMSAVMLLGGSPARADEGADQSALLKALPGAKVSLQQGLQAATGHGRPISAKYEIDDGKLQLSIYTDKAGKFSEVVVDYKSGRVARAQAITAGDDLTAAQAQARALADVKESLKAAVTKAEHDAAGYRAVGAVPEQGDKGKVVKVMLAKGAELKTVDVPVK